MKERIQKSWMVENGKFQKISKGRFRGLVRNNGTGMKIIGICIDTNGIPVGINTDILTEEGKDVKQIGTEYLKELCSGNVSEEDRDNGMRHLASIYKGGIAEQVMVEFDTAFQDVISEEEHASAGYRIICDTIRKREAENIRKFILDPLIERDLVNRQSLDIVSNAPSPTEKSYVFYNVEGERRKLRHQAAQSFPSMANIISDRISLRKAVDNMEPLQGALSSVFGKNEAGNPILTKSMMKRINGRVLDFMGHDERMISIFSALSELPPDWFPKDDGEWKDFLTVHTTIGQAIHGGDRDWMKMYKASAGKWGEFRKLLSHAWRDQRPPEGATKADMDYVEKAIDFKALSKMSRNDIIKSAPVIAANIPLPSNLNRKTLSKWICDNYAPPEDDATFSIMEHTAQDVAIAMSKRIVLPCIAYASEMRNIDVSRKTDAKSIEIAKSMIFDGRSLSDSLEILRKMRSQIGGLTMAPVGVQTDNPDRERKTVTEELSDADNVIMREYLASPGDNQEWSFLVNPFVIGGVACVPLTTSELLSYEGEFMNHCVGDYHVTLCQQHQERIFSIRKKGNNGIQTLATMAVNVHDGKLAVGCTLGYGNTSNIASAAVNIKNIMTQKVSEMNRKGKAYILNTLRGDDQADVNISEYTRSIESDAGYDWEKAENIGEAMKPWGSFVSKPWRKAPDKIMASEQIMDAARDINPLAGKQKRHRSSESPAP